MRRLAAAIVLAALPLAALPLAACSGGGGGAGAAADPSGAGSSGPSGAPAVSLQRFGGFAGNRDAITVQPDGSWRRTAKTGAATTGTLTADRRDQLSRMAADPALVAEATRTVPESDCADAFDYSLTVGGTRVAWRDCGATPAPPATASRMAQFLLESTNPR